MLVAHDCQIFMGLGHAGMCLTRINDVLVPLHRAENQFAHDAAVDRATGAEFN